MAAKTTIVTLEVGARREDFEFSHAERILKMRNNGGWHLPEGSKFVFENNALYRRPTKKESR